MYSFYFKSTPNDVYFVILETEKLICFHASYKHIETAFAKFILLLPAFLTLVCKF